MDMNDGLETLALVDLAEMPLSHSGVKGMKWGVWNAETRARYTGQRLKSSAQRLSKKTGAAAKGTADLIKRKSMQKAGQVIAAQKEKREKQKVLAEQRKELGMPKAQYDKLRERTLRSNDPEVVAKGMHTLTDDELNQKITRLKKEETITNMAASKEAKRHANRQARNNALNANPAVQLAKNITEAKLKQMLGISKKSDKKNDKGNASNDNNNGGNKDDSQTTNANAEDKGGSKKNNKNSKKNGRSDSVNASVQGEGTANTPRAGNAKKKGVDVSAKQAVNDYRNSTVSTTLARRGEDFLATRKDIIDVAIVRSSRG